MSRLNIKHIAKSHKVSPKKHLGQNFLNDDNVIYDIVLVADVGEGVHILEIGPGLGNMTKALLEGTKAKMVTVVEFDKRCIEALEELQTTLSDPSRLNIIQKDAITFDEEALGAPLSIISNLPYNIGTKLLIKWLGKLHLFDQLILMLQKEVVERLTAKPSTKAYGRLSIITQLLCQTEKVLDVPPKAFWPVPKVDSAVVRLIPRPEPLYACDIKHLQQVCKAAFMQRRKFLSKNLKAVYGEGIDEIFQKLGLNAKARAEELSIEQFCALSNLIRLAV